ncbi:MAG TPA: hypothetical protein VMI31_14770, partial [Fimbriimonadaceae bacterium]|nr:hypothetical protein [Fimbriimonadaceae bacterium]
AGAFDDPRVHVHVADAFPFVKEADRSYDLVVMDSTDTYEGEDGALSEQLFTEAFYRDCCRALTQNGLLVTQADNLLFCPYSLEGILQTLASVFPEVGSYQALIPSFGGFSGFAWASKGAELSRHWRQAWDGLRYLNPVTFSLAFQPLGF